MKSNSTTTSLRDEFCSVIYLGHDAILYHFVIWYHPLEIETTLFPDVMEAIHVVVSSAIWNGYV